MPSTELPPFTEAGQPGDWELTDRYGSVVRLKGDFLGMGSSHHPFHNHAFPPHVARGERCSSCRWIEIRIFQHLDGRYLVVQTGRTIVPGERELTTLGWAEGGPAVVAATISRSPDGGRLYFTFVAKRVLEDASAYDDGINEAYRAALERVVT